MNIDRATLSELEHQRGSMITYLKMKLEQADWHGVQDAASDLRELEVAIVIRQREQPLGV